MVGGNADGRVRGKEVGRERGMEGGKHNSVGVMVGWNAQGMRRLRKGGRKEERERTLLVTHHYIRG